MDRCILSKRSSWLDIAESDPCLNPIGLIFLYEWHDELNLILSCADDNEFEDVDIPQPAEFSIS